MSKVEPRKSEEKPVSASQSSSSKKLSHPKQEQSVSQSVKVPTAKKGPLVFDDEGGEEPKPVIVSGSKREHFSSKLESSAEHSISKEERVNFSDEEESEESVRNQSAMMARKNFNKKNSFAPILEEPDLENKSSKIQKLNSPRGVDKSKAELQALSEENKGLQLKLEKASQELEAERKSRTRLI